VILPDATILLDYMQSLALRVARGMVVHADRMARNLDITCGALFSQTVLLALVEGGMTRDEAYRIVQETAQQAWDTQTPLRDLLAEQELGLDLDAIFDYGRFTRHVPELLARLDAILVPGVSDALLMRAAPGASADLFHALPLDILDPFLYAELPDRKGRRDRRARARPDRGAGVGDRDPRPFALGLDSLLNDGVDFLSAEIETDLRAVKEIGLESALVPPDFPLAWADKLRGAGVELRVDDQAFDLRRRRKTDAQLAGIRRARPPPTPRWAPPRRCCASCPAGLTCEQVRERMQAVCKEHDAELPDDRDRRPRRAVGVRPRGGPRPDRPRRHRPDRHLAARPRVALLGGHDAHVRRRRRGAARRAAGVLGAHPRVARAVMPMIKPGAVCREIHARRASRTRRPASRRSAPRSPDTRSRRATTTARPRGRARGARAPEPRAQRRAA
jgi:hypothetical protein